MRYWDPSAIVALLASEPDSGRRTGQLTEDGQAVTWWSSKVECVSALNRRLQAGVLDEAGFKAASGTLAIFLAACGSEPFACCASIPCVPLMRFSSPRLS